MSDLISIIVPAFNCEDYLERCVRSVLGQSHRELELIVVNDASPDGTAAVLGRLAKEDSRLKAINLEENVGVHAARAEGLRNAGGRYVGFVDADDWISSTMLSDMHAAAVREEADIVVCGAVLAASEGNTGRNKVRFRRRQVYRTDILGRFARLGFGTGVLWNKLYRMEIIRPYALEPLERSVDAAEDYIVNIGCFDAASTVVVVPETHYYYFELPASASRAASNARSFSRTIRAYVVCLEKYAGRSGDFFGQIDALYGRLLKLRSYRIGSTDELASYQDEIRASLERLAAIHPSGVYSLIHAFDPETGSRRVTQHLRAVVSSLKGLGRCILGGERNPSLPGRTS